MAIRQILVLAGSVAFMLLMTFLWGLIATGGDSEAASRYLRAWLRVIGMTALAAGVIFLIVWPFIG